MKNLTAREFLTNPGAAVAKAREERGMKQKELADKSEVNYDIISIVEHNKRDVRISTYKKIFQGLDLLEKSD